MSFSLRLLVVAAAGFLISRAHTSTPSLALVCLVPVLIALYAPNPAGEPRRGRSPGPWRAALLGFVAYASAGAHVWGIAQYGWFIYLAGVLYLALGGGLFGLLAWPFLESRQRWVRVVGITCAWVLAESTRTMTPYSYPMLLGPCLGDFPLISQMASLAGPWGMDALVALVSASLAEAFEVVLIRRHPWLPQGRPGPWVATAATALAAAILFGAVRLLMAGPPGAALWVEGQPPEKLPEAPLTVATVQGGVPTWFYRRANALGRLQEVVDANYLTLLDEALAARPMDAPPAWVVLPESALGRFVLPGDAGLRAQIGLTRRTLPEGTTLLLGVTTELRSPDPDYPRANRENAAQAIVTDPTTRQLTVSDHVTKRLLVPIAEDRYRPADAWRPLEGVDSRLGVLICYESMYPHIAQELADAGAQALVVITNDAGLRWSLAPRVHARLGRLRAIETGLSMVHAGQAGITFFSDAYGRATEEMDIFERGVMVGAVSTRRAWTLYGVVGRWWLALFGLVWLAGALHALIRTKSSA